MKRVLVTGASGFIGRNCLGPLRARGYEVYAVSSRCISESGQYRWHRADLLDRSQIAPLVAAVQPTHLLHLAWMVVPGESYKSLANIDWVQSSLDLVREFARHGGRRVVVAGTCYEYDQCYGVCHEDRTPRRPDTVYGAAKNALQELLAAYAAADGLSVAWPRVFFLYGPHEHPRRLVSSVICSLLRGEAAACSHGGQLRDYLYVEDLAEALAALLETDSAGPINIGSGVPVALRDIVECIGDRIGRSELVRLGALPAREGEVPLIVADTAKATAELSWRPRFTLEAGVDKTIAWWKRELAKGQEQC